MLEQDLTATFDDHLVDHHLVDQSPSGALPEIECRFGAPEPRKSHQISLRSFGFCSNLAHQGSLGASVPAAS